MFPQALNLKISLIVFQCREKSPQALNLANYLMCTDVEQSPRKP